MQSLLTGLIALLTAFAVDMLIGDPPNHLHPVVLMGNFIQWMRRTFNSGSNIRRFILGLVWILIGVALFGLPWLWIQSLLARLPFWAAGILTGLLLKPMFAYRGLLKAGREVQAALAGKDLTEARRLVAWHLVSRDTSQLSAPQVVSATIESLAENLTDSFVAPLIYFALGGLPLAWMYRFVNTADAMIGYHTPEYEFFGKFPARADDVLNWLPARISGWILVLAACLTRLNPTCAARTMWTQHARTASPNAGWTMAAAAGALYLTLEKINHYRLEGGDRPLTEAEIGRALDLVQTALLFSLLLMGGLIYVRSLLF